MPFGFGLWCSQSLDFDIYDRCNVFCHTRLHIQTSSWKKDSFGLFDFECKELQTQTFKHEGTGKIIREQRIENNDKRKVKINIKT